MIKNRHKLSLLVVLTLIITIIFIHGCTLFQPQTGVWVCEELGITVDFDDRDKINGTVRAIIDGEEKEYVLGMDATGSAGFFPIEDIDKSMEKTYYLYRGWFINKGENKMIFRLKENRKEYIFVRQNPME